MTPRSPIDLVPPDPLTFERPLSDWLALGVLAAVTGIALLTFRDYGLGWDDYTHSEYGALLLRFYGSGFGDRRAFSFVNLYMYGGGFDMLAGLAAKALPFTLFETRRLVGALVGLVGLFVTWRIGRRVGGPLAGLLALVLLAACPLYVGHMYINAKDFAFRSRHGDPAARPSARLRALSPDRAVDWRADRHRLRPFDRIARSRRIWRA